MGASLSANNLAADERAGESPMGGPQAGKAAKWPKAGRVGEPPGAQIGSAASERPPDRHWREARPNSSLAANESGPAGLESAGLSGGRGAGDNGRRPAELRLHSRRLKVEQERARGFAGGKAAASGGGQGARLEGSARQEKGETLPEVSSSQTGAKMDEIKLGQAIEASVRRQVAEQLKEDQPLGRQLNEQFSAYFGEPVMVRARLD